MTRLSELDRERRQAVLRFRAVERRRVHDPVVHVGRPFGRVADFVDQPAHRMDQALRRDVAAALLSRARASTAEPWAWLTRSGALEVEDVDLAWLSAVRGAGAEVGLDVPFLVVTRAGWFDPRTGETCVWQRLRVRT